MMKPTDLAQPAPADVRIVIAVPTIEQYVDLFASVGWAIDREYMEVALKNTVVGVMAVDGDGEPIGMARIIGDGMYFTLWDVIVRPSYQRRRVGSALVEAALKELRNHVRPAAFIGLFSGNHGFYERLGFKKGGALHRGVR